MVGDMGAVQNHVYLHPASGRGNTARGAPKLTAFHFDGSKPVAGCPGISGGQGAGEPDAGSVLPRGAADLQAQT
jgi:hypothetical protein